MEDTQEERQGRKSWKKFDKPQILPIEQDEFVTQVIQSLKLVNKPKEKAGKGRPKACSDADIANAIVAAGGFVSRASEMLNMHYTSVHQRIQKSPELKSLVDHIKEKMLDYGELELLKAMKRGESWAICFFLKCKGKDRGYVEKQTLITAKDDNSISIVIE